MYYMSSVPLGGATLLRDRIGGGSLSQPGGGCMGCAFGEPPPPPPASARDVVLQVVASLVQKYFPEASDATARAFAEELKPELPQLAIRIATPIALALMITIGVLWIATRSTRTGYAPARRRPSRRR